LPKGTPLLYPSPCFSMEYVCKLYGKSYVCGGEKIIGYIIAPYFRIWRNKRNKGSLINELAVSVK
jgi:hypothetical protein